MAAIKNVPNSSVLKKQRPVYHRLPQYISLHRLPQRLKTRQAAEILNQQITETFNRAASDFDSGIAR